MGTPDAFAGRVALVTGASSGIGRAIALRLGAAGADVATVYGRSADAAAAVVAQIEAGGGTATAFQADLEDPEACRGLVPRVEQALGPVDVLVPAAGIGDRRELRDVELDDWDRTMAVNARAPFLLAQAAVPGMRARGFGRILFLSSVAAFTGGVVGPHYAASKAALHGLTHLLASRLAGHGITVNALAPALITDTKMLPGAPAELAAKIPAGRLGTPEEVADLAVAMLRNGYLTDQVVSLDGGMYPR